MDRSSRLFVHTFFRAFIVLFLILIVVPFIVDCVFHSFSGNMPPGSNSIIVFKEYIADKELIGRFIETLIKIMLFM